MIHNGSKRTMFTSGGLELLQIVSKPDNGQCGSEDARPPRGWIVRSTSVGEGNETFLIWV